MPRLQAARPAALPRDKRSLRAQADQALSRAAGAPLIEGNQVRILRDGAENYPTWARAIIDARQTIHIEMYIVHRDQVGKRFIELLATRAREGVRVRFVYDWWGCGTGPLLGLFRPLVQAGGEVRAFNPPTFRSVLGWTHRNHRKVITIDGRVTYISGLCIGQMWEGYENRQQAPWRDTGIEIMGPALAPVEQSFADSWELAGGEIDRSSLPGAEDISDAGSVALRVVTTEPFTATMLQLDWMVAALARRQLWITDAYFIGNGPYVEALRRAAADGVDVRLLLPHGSDVGWTVPLARTMYRTLLDAGVRVFEWNGPMLHAKTAVADGTWARVGSTNLNLVSWLGNWELDVAIEDADVAGRLAAQFQLDLAQSTEIVTDKPRSKPTTSARLRAQRSARRARRTVRGVGSSMTAAVTGSRPIEDFEIVPLIGGGLVLAAIALLAVWKPAAVAWPIALVAGWTGLSFMGEALVRWNPSPDMTERASVAAIRRWKSGRLESDQDLVTVESALHVRLERDDDTAHVDLGILMRTPGDDQDLLLGLLHSEGLISAAADVVSVVPQRHSTHDMVVVHVAAHVDLQALARSRALVTTSACGLCGRLEMLAVDRRRVDTPPAARLSPDMISALPSRLSEEQAVFAQTGGLHAAGLFTLTGTLHEIREDVGRHNAVDKVIGAACRSGELIPGRFILAVSGRVAFEIVQKAVMAGIDAIVAVGAPSSLALDAARRTGVALIGFARPGRFNVYSGADRLMQ